MVTKGKFGKLISDRPHYCRGKISEDIECGYAPVRIVFAEMKTIDDSIRNGFHGMYPHDKTHHSVELAFDRMSYILTRMEGWLSASETFCGNKDAAVFMDCYCFYLKELEMLFDELDNKASSV